MRKPSGFCGISGVSKSDFAFTVVPSGLSATIEIRSNVACASSLGLVRKNSIVKIMTRPLSALREVYYGKARSLFKAGGKRDDAVEIAREPPIVVQIDCGSSDDTISVSLVSDGPYPPNRWFTVAAKAGYGLTGDPVDEIDRVHATFNDL
jgi:hypothetical protein